MYVVIHGLLSHMDFLKQLLMVPCSSQPWDERYHDAVVDMLMVGVEA